MKETHVAQLAYQGGRLNFGGIALDELATRFGTPTYVYNFDIIRRKVRELHESLSSCNSLICYAVKANSSPELLKMMGSLGLGVDAVSIGEILCARKAGIQGSKIVFSGVAKTVDEIARAAAENIFSFNVESPGEIQKLRHVAKQQNKVIAISLRINPDIDAKTHPKIATGLHATKFGLEPRLAKEMAQQLLGDPQLKLTGVSCHIGSQILELDPLKEAAQLMLRFAQELREMGHDIQKIDLGGGLGVAYRPEDRFKAPSLKAYGLMLAGEFLKMKEQATLVIEPGRSLVAEAGVLLSRVIEVKQTGSRTFVMLDAGMNDLVRPALYDAYHHILPVWDKGQQTIVADIVGPVCETGDFFAIDREVPVLQEGDHVAVLHAGAYGFSMASHYNMRPKPAEIAIIEKKPEVVRARETLEKLF